MILLVNPAEAVSIRHIDITVSVNGDALVVADYSLNWAEQAIVYPATVPLLAGSAGKNIRVHSVSFDKAQLTIRHFANVRQNLDTTTYNTPAFSLADASLELDKFWFGDMIALDGASGYLTIRFPDGATVEYQNLNSVPSLEHAVPRM
jgi:hypothetical protein